MYHILVEEQQGLLFLADHVPDGDPLAAVGARHDVAEVRDVYRDLALHHA